MQTKFLRFVLLNLILTYFSVSSLNAAILKNIPSWGTSNPLLSRQLFGYLAYGEPKGTDPGSLPLVGIGYTGRQHDDTGLMYYRGRYYDQCTGSVIQEDPKRDGWNWYGYSNDPVNYNDPSGYRSDPNTNWLEESIANDSFQRNKCDPLFKNDFGLDPYLEAILNTATEVTATVVVNAALGGMVGVVARGAMAAAPKGGLTRSAGAWAKNLYRKADRTLVWQKNPVGVNAGILGNTGSALGKNNLQDLPAPRQAQAAWGANNSPDFIISPNGTAFPVPKGATGPTPIFNSAGKQTGVGFTGGAGGANGQVSTMRIMNPTSARGNNQATRMGTSSTITRIDRVSIPIQGGLYQIMKITFQFIRSLLCPEYLTP